MSARKKARKRAMDLLYSADLKSMSFKDSLAEEEARAALEHNRQSSWAYAKEIVEGVIEHSKEIDRTIEENAHGWTIERMPLVDLAILRIGVWELKYANGIPVAVAISEAVEAARLYSTDDSPGFINGLLAKLAQHPSSERL
ncbi:MAG: transcription antitermination factor NusB [Microbacteriaceae bacterium]|nr:transcription antitermination factor NusB [Microbacteriaceae bacterium]